MSKLNRAARRVLDKLSAVTGVDIAFFESEAGEGGGFEGANGFYRDSVVYLDINAGANTVHAQSAVLLTAAHEFTHFIRENSPAQYEILKDSTAEMANDKLLPHQVSFDIVSRNKMSLALVTEFVGGKKIKKKFAKTLPLQNTEAHTPEARAGQTSDIMISLTESEVKTDFSRKDSSAGLTKQEAREQAKLYQAEGERYTEEVPGAGTERSAPKGKKLGDFAVNTNLRFKAPEALFSANGHYAHTIFQSFLLLRTARTPATAVKRLSAMPSTNMTL